MYVRANTFCVTFHCTLPKKKIIPQHSHIKNDIPNNKKKCYVQYICKKLIYIIQYKLLQ